MIVTLWFAVAVADIRFESQPLRVAALVGLAAALAGVLLAPVVFAPGGGAPGSASPLALAGLALGLALVQDVTGYGLTPLHALLAVAAAGAAAMLVSRFHTLDRSGRPGADRGRWSRGGCPREVLPRGRHAGRRPRRRHAGRGGARLVRRARADRRESTPSTPWRSRTRARATSDSPMSPRAAARSASRSPSCRACSSTSVSARVCAASTACRCSSSIHSCTRRARPCSPGSSTSSLRASCSCSRCRSSSSSRSRS